jgi:hypothetical protein
LLELFFNGKIILGPAKTRQFTDATAKESDGVIAEDAFYSMEPDTPLSPEAQKCVALGHVIRSSDLVHEVLNCLVINVIHVRDVPAPTAHTTAFFARVNRRINALHIDRHGDESACGSSLNADILLRIASQFSWEEAWQLSMVNVYWYLTIVRYFLLIQLDINFAYKSEQPYPFVLNSWINEYTYQLAQSSASLKSPRFDGIWDQISPQKFYFSGHSMKTIYTSILERNDPYSLTQQKYLRSTRHEFFTLFQPIDDRNTRDKLLLNERPFSAETSYVFEEEKQVRPPKKSTGFTCEAIIPLYLNASISILSGYFSQNMKYFIPLMAYKV